MSTAVSTYETQTKPTVAYHLATDNPNDWIKRAQSFERPGIRCRAFDATLITMKPQFQRLYVHLVGLLTCGQCNNWCLDQPYHICFSGQRPPDADHGRQYCHRTWVSRRLTSARKAAYDLHLYRHTCQSATASGNWLSSPISWNHSLITKPWTAACNYQRMFPLGHQGQKLDREL